MRKKNNYLYLADERIPELVKEGKWDSFPRPSNYGDSCIMVRSEAGAFELYVELGPTNIAVVFFVKAKGITPNEIKKLYQEKIGDEWKPEPDSVRFYQNKNIDPQAGNVGKWTFDFGRDLLGANLDKVKRVANKIDEKLRESGIYDELKGSNVTVSGDEQKKETDSGDDSATKRNLIIFGAPGTGKSYKLEEDRKKDFPDKYERVTFYPTYSYAQFVGTYKPVMRPGKKDTVTAEREEEIAYEFVPGPFLRVLVNALKEPVTNGKKNGWCLIIEEINRANAAAVFGDVFQLLDRGSDGVSEYSVAVSEDVKKYLRKELNDCEDARLFLKVVDSVDNNGNVVWSSCSLRIPDNMYIWATMNSADQGVFPMDTAFKRRWEFEYVGINDGEGKASEWTIGEANSNSDPKWNWNANRKLINRLLTLCGVNEDKLMGPFFVTATGGAVSKEQFKSKVLMYLWEDAARMCHSKLFPKVKTYSELVEQWGEKGPGIFENVMNNGPSFCDDDLAKEYWGNLCSGKSDETETADHGAQEANVKTAQS